MVVGGDGHMFIDDLVHHGEAVDFSSSSLEGLPA